jgi:protein Mpv17
LPGLWFFFYSRITTTNSLQITLSLNITPILQFVTYSILNTPINCYWQDFLEASFPSNVPANVEVPNKQKKTTTLETKKALSIKNTLIKFFMDQTIGAAFNIPLFIGIIGMVKGQNVETITNNVKVVCVWNEMGVV